MKYFARVMLLSSCLSFGCQGVFNTGNNGNTNNENNSNNYNNSNNNRNDVGIDVETDGTIEPKLCQTPEAVFERETWPVAGSAICTGCHIAGGVAESQGATFILKNETALATEGILLDEFYAYNLEQFRNFRTPDAQDIPMFISKAMGKGHAGGAVALPESEALIALQALEASFETEGEEECEELEPLDPISDLVQLTPEQTLRKATMMLASRLPTADESAQLVGTEEEQLAALDMVLDDVMQGEDFHSWLKYAWNEVFMFRGLWELDVTFEFMVVSQPDFGISDWGFIGRAGGVGCDLVWEGQPVWQRFNYPSEAACANNTFARNYMQKRIAYSLMEEPLELIAYVIEQDMPFSEILTTETVMMNYYSSTVYYGSGQAADNPYVQQHLNGLPVDTVEHPGGSTLQTIDLPTMHEFQPMTSMKRSRRARPGGAGTPLLYQYRTPEEYPRSGILSSQLWLTRYPTTDTNVNRHRTWAFMNQFLGVDILALADRRGDPTEAELNSEQPTIDDPNCNVCHNVMDPVAGLFQDFGIEARWLPNATWPPTDQPPMIPPGNAIIGPNIGTLYDVNTHGDPMQWLAAQTVQDERFATTMVRHAFMQLTGHKPMNPPTDSEVEGWRGVRTAFELESIFLSDLREIFVASGFNMKTLYKAIIASPYYRGIQPASDEVAADPDRLASLSSYGVGDQLLTPFELTRKIESIIGRPWQHRSFVMRGNNLNVIDENAPQNDFLTRFNSENDFRYVDTIYRDMYGGIDFFNNTSRLTLPSSVMAAAGRRMAYELACATVAQDFAIDPRGRVLFATVSPGDTMQSNPNGIEQTITDLFERMYGYVPSAEEMTTTIALYNRVMSQGQQSQSPLPAHCQAQTMVPGQNGVFTAITDDTTYGIRAWMAVVSYLALDPQFLFEW